MIDIIIPVYNHYDYLDICLRFLYKSTNDYRLIIVDAGSDAETSNYIDKLTNAHVIRSEKRINFSKACNLGLQESNSKYVAFLNSDVIVSNEWLKKLKRYLDSDDNIAAVSATSNLQVPIMSFSGYGNIKIEDILSIVDSIYDWMSRKLDFEISYTKMVEFYACLARRNLLKFDEEYDNGFEDYDLCYRLGEIGYKVCRAPDVLVFHFGAISRGG